MKYYKIAAKNVAMNVSSERLQKSAAKYEIERPENIDIVLDGYDEAARRNSMLVDGVSSETWEEILSGDDFYEQLLDFDATFLHSSAIVVEKKAYLISAGSQVGKTYHTRLWMQYLGTENVVILNDDKPAIAKEADGIWYAYGTPWSGASEFNENMKAPIGAICYLTRSDKNWIQAEKGPRILHDFVGQTIKPRDEERRIRLFTQFSDLITSVPSYRMGVNMDISAARMAYEVMTGRVRI